jgi:Ca2+-binding RTX toxin-like protein
MPKRRNTKKPKPFAISIGTGTTDFNEDFYLEANPDVRAAIEAGVIASAIDHYQRFGALELRDPNPYFNARYYANQYPDALDATTRGSIANIFEHYARWGYKDGRRPSATFVTLNEFDWQTYLANNNDLRANGISTAESAYEHYLRYGISENRPGAQTLNGVALSGGRPEAPTPTTRPSPASQTTNNNNEATGSPSGPSPRLLSGTDTLTVNTGETVTARIIGNWSPSSSTYNHGTVNLSFSNIPLTLDLSMIDTTSAASRGFHISAAGNTAAVSVLASRDSDTLIGGSGNDQLEGGHGIDTITGGAGADLFVQPYGESAATTTGFVLGGSGTALIDGVSTFNYSDGLDLVMDFDASVDRLDTSGTGSTDLATLTNLGPSGQFTMDTNYYVTGNFDRATNTFTYSSTGADVLYFVDRTSNNDLLSHPQWGLGATSIVLLGGANSGATPFSGSNIV